jgi:hypothetical protein
MTDIDFDARYRVDGYGGVAFYLKGYATTEEYEGDYLVCEDEDCDHQSSDTCWIEGDTSIVTDHDHVIAVMVGDDRKHVIDVDDLEMLADDDYCSGCGQIGCTADGR